MPLVDHIGVTVADLDVAIAQWDPLLTALGLVSDGREFEGGVAWNADGETEIILYRASVTGSGPLRSGQLGWQHLAFALESRAAVERVHGIAVRAGWTSVRDPKTFPRFSERYYASFIEDETGIRVELMHNPPQTSPPDGGS
ncbi:Lactoylglutathione lyase [Leucobacter sp. 7(1)]|uniref:hypothetical protein n=1 Tax=Leucobacter sp. 7(1) TaxID=1255613 RepID=UPI00097F1DBE|nr:hypothetical protein [Leucobacter sp. 7(1)]SJN08929.1 Lactoylglutathione lyase [Leucobacter sp. 7(1)]